MKNLFLAAIAVMGIMSSCSEDQSEIIQPVEGSVATVSFVEESASSRAFFDPTATAEVWEKSLTSVMRIKV